MGKLSCPLTLDWASARAQSTVAGPSTASAEPARHLAWKRCSANAFGRLNRRQSTMGSRLPNRRSGIQYKATEASGVQVFQGDVAQHFHEKSGDASANPSIADASAPEAHQEQASRTKR